MIYYIQRMDGKSGNLVVVDIEIDYQHVLSTELTITYNRITLISDYGNLVYIKYSLEYLKRQFYLTTGIATKTHKHYNYKENHPEIFI